MLKHFDSVKTKYMFIQDCVKSIIPPKKLNRSEYKEQGKYPVVDQGQKFIVGYTDDIDVLLPPDDYVVFGEHTRIIKYINFPFAQGADGLKILVPKTTEINVKYLYYATLNVEIPNRGYNRHWGILSKMKIPIPPLPVQEAIVRILDKFTLLKAELEAELEARTVQYDHYRDALLDFSNSLTTVQPTILENLLNKFGEANQMLLDELVSHNLGGGTPSKAISSYWGGEIPWASVKDIVGKGMFIDETKDSITEKGLKNSSSNLIPSGWLIICTRINPGVCAISTKDVAINQDLRALKLHDFVNTKFLWHYLQTIRIIGKGTTVKGISVDELGRIPVPVPPLPVQEAIVDILDRFEAIVHDIQDGLPAEIALRQKQYEYYRDKLLTFEPLETETKAA